MEQLFKETGPIAAPTPIPTSPSPAGPPEPKLDKKFVISRQGREFVLFAGVLDLAHRQGLKRISTELLQIPAEHNFQTAIVRAEVETAKGVYTGLGDANPTNVSRAMLTATIRLAETRAKARALRDAVNVGALVLEEEDDAEEVGAPVPTSAATEPTPIGERRAAAPASKSTTSSTPAPSGGALPHEAPPPIAPRSETSGDRATANQVRFIRELAGQAGIPTEGLLKLCAAYGFASPETATRGQASKLVDVLKSKVANH